MQCCRKPVPYFLKHERTEIRKTDFFFFASFVAHTGLTHRNTKKEKKNILRIVIFLALKRANPLKNINNNRFKNIISETFFAYFFPCLIFRSSHRLNCSKYMKNKNTRLYLRIFTFLTVKFVKKY